MCCEDGWVCKMPELNNLYGALPKVDAGFDITDFAQFIPFFDYVFHNNEFKNGEFEACFEENTPAAKKKCH